MTDDDLDDLDEFTAALHDVVLPVSVPVLPGLDLAAHFSVPAEPGEATGAWFDVVRLRSGAVALVLGQVPGSGLAVVAGAGAVSAVIRAGLLCDEDVLAALHLATLHAEHTPALKGTAVVVAMLDPQTRELTYATAGHPAPVVVPAAGPSHELERTAAGRLGSGTDPVASHHTLEVGDLVLLSSRIEALTASGAPVGTSSVVTDIVDRTRVVGDATATCEAYADALAQQQARGAVSVVVAELTAARPTPLDLVLDVDDATTRRARVELGQWLDSIGAASADVLSLTHAAAELVVNAVEHAYGSDGVPTGAGGVRLHASQADDGVVTVEVGDRGRWRPPVEADIARGRGLAMAAGLVDDLTVTRDAGESGGTIARLRHRLTRPVLVDRAVRTSTWPADEPLVVDRAALGVVRLAGEFGHDEVDQLTYALLLASQGRTQPLDVDLSDVTSISAGGLSLLGELVGADAEPARAEITLHARRGSVSQVELERAGIAHRAS